MSGNGGPGALCAGCAHRRLPAGEAEPTVSVSDRPRAPDAAHNQRLFQLKVDRETEDAAVQRQSARRLPFVPRRHTWCEARSQGDEYFFCQWLLDDHCDWYDSTGPDQRPRPTDGGRRRKGHREPPAGWSVELGAVIDAAIEMAPVKSALEVEYELDKLSGDTLRLDEDALFQTCMLFGGPGAGKTHLFKRILSQVLAHPARPGCLLLDPKGVLQNWAQETLARGGRSGDLLVISPKAPRPCNILDLPSLGPQQIGRLLSEVVMAEAGAIDEGWSILIADLLESAAVVSAEISGGKVDAASLLASVTQLVAVNAVAEDGTKKRVQRYPIQVQAAELLGRRGVDPDVVLACRRIHEFFDSTEDRQRRYVRQCIDSSFSELAKKQWGWLSDRRSDLGLYQDVHDHHRVVVVSIGQGLPAFQRSLCTLMKAGYQQTVLASLDPDEPRSTRGAWSVLACDEYAQIATEGKSGLVSDASFFSLSREAGCMAVLALQSLATGRSRFDPSIRDRWEGILGNVGLRFFMRLNDMETAKMASELAGRTTRLVVTQSHTYSTESASIAESHVQLDLEVAPPWLFPNWLPRGYAFVHGTVEAAKQNVSTFIKVPEDG